MFTSPFRTHELATISVLMIHTHTRGIPMIGSTVMVHVAPGKWQLRVIMVFVVLVWHMTQKSPVSVRISWIFKTTIIHVTYLMLIIMDKKNCLLTYAFFKLMDFYVVIYSYILCILQYTVIDTNSYF